MNLRRSLRMSRKRKSWISVGIVLIAGAVAASVVASSPRNSESRASASRCSPGQVSKFKIPRVAPGSKERRTTPVIVLACGADPSGDRFQVVGYGITSSICVAVDHPQDHETRILLCKPTNAAWVPCQSERLCLNPPSVVSTSGELRTELVGEVTAEASAVRINYLLKGKNRSTGATLGRISGPIMEELHIDQAGGVFLGILPGCVHAKTLRVIGLDSRGHPLATKRAASGFAQTCTAKSGKASGYRLIVEP